MKRLCRLAAVGVIAVTLIVGFRPSSAQLVVFDPNNYAQNVLTPVGRSKSPGYGHLKLPHSIIAVSAAEQR